jgi:hypothetical protein
MNTARLVQRMIKAQGEPELVVELTIKLEPGSE